jgi:HD-GYP domain-containing protein (c-di-GMP phosphodiesterase class II)
LREVLLADRVAWEDEGLVVEGARRPAPEAVAAAEWWVPLVAGAGAHRADAVGAVLSGLADLLDARHPCTRGRSLAVAELAIRMAGRLRLGRDRLGEVEEAASLHRVGTALVDSYPDAPAGSREHPRLPAVTASLLAGAGRAPEVVQAVRGLAERWDGAGPEGLAGISIPAPSRIVAVAAAWMELVAPWQAGPDGRSHLATELVERRAARDLVARAGADLDPRAVGALLEETDASAAL